MGSSSGGSTASRPTKSTCSFRLALAAPYGVIQVHEAELLRAIADSLDCPIPPFIPPLTV